MKHSSIKFKEAFSLPLRNGLTKPSKVRGSGVPMVNMKEIFAYNKIYDDTPMELVPVTDKELENTSLEYGDLLFARQSLTEEGAGKICIYKGHQTKVFESHLIRCRLDTNRFDSDYFYYFFSSTTGKALVSTIVQQTAAAGIRGSDLQELEIPVPTLPEQKAIASVLSSLDDKIDLLHRQNKTLEAMAETLFRQWFIEEAKEDWDDLLVRDIAVHIKDNVNPSKNPLETFYHYSLPAFDSGEKPTIEVGSDILSNKYRVAENSILVSKLNPRVPRIWLLANVEDNYVCSTEFQNLKPKVASHLMFLYCLFKSRDVIDELTMSASGTSSSHQRVKPQDMLNISFKTPSLDYLEEYSLLIAPSMQKVLSNKQQIQTLEQLRDTLLPKLMSGEVRIQYQTEEVA